MEAGSNLIVKTKCNVVKITVTVLYRINAEKHRNCIQIGTWYVSYHQHKLKLLSDDDLMALTPS